VAPVLRKLLPSVAKAATGDEGLVAFGERAGIAGFA
jgi:hypothetical protein